jgi:hypothetical protein
MRVDKPEAIKEVLDKVKSSYEPNPNRYLRDGLIFWMICSGVHLYNMSEIKVTDINSETGKIKVNGIEYDIIDEEMVAFINEWVKCDYVESERFGPVYLDNSDYLFRPNVIDRVFDDKSGSGVFIAALNRISNQYFEATGRRITIDSLGVSIPGLFSDVAIMIDVE